MIFGVAFEVVSQLRNAASQKGNLHICAAGIVFVELKLPHVHRVTSICHNQTATLGEETGLARGVFGPAARKNPRLTQKVNLASELRLEPLSQGGEHEIWGRL